MVRGTYNRCAYSETWAKIYFFIVANSRSRPGGDIDMQSNVILPIYGIRNHRSQNSVANAVDVTQ